MRKLKLALMDMNNGVKNRGMNGLRELIGRFLSPGSVLPSNPGLLVDEYEVRKKHQIPGLEYDIYVSSGGPGDPRKMSSSWAKQWLKLVEKIWMHNQTHDDKKYFFFVCHSFQMVCGHFGLCDITKRKSTSFGIYPIHKTEPGKKDQLLSDLKDPYLGFDSRDWQLVQPNKKVFDKFGAQIISLEKIRTHVEYERAIMAIRFTPEMVGTQFHPEADQEGLRKYFKQKVNRDKVIKNFDGRKYEKMMHYLDQPETIGHTYDSVVPGFLKRAVESLTTIRIREHAA